MTFYAFAHALLRVLMPLLFQPRYVGLENIPRAGHFILLSNHTNALDVLPMGMAVYPRPVHFVAKDSLFRTRLGAFFLRKLNAFPVRRGQGDMAAMRQCIRVLREGNVLGIFPEGTRTKTGAMRRIETGVAVLALKAEVPLVPVYITGRYRPFGRLCLRAGAPIALDDLLARGTDSETLELIRARIEGALHTLAQTAAPARIGGGAAR